MMRFRHSKQLSVQDAPSLDLVGGSLGAQPPHVADTAADLAGFASWWLLETATEHAKDARCASLNAARYIVQFQFSSENSYYLVDSESALGGFRNKPGGNLATLHCAAQALESLNLLEDAMMKEAKRKSD
jgi:hypothetical protein